MDGWTSKHCDEDVDECLNHPCSDGAKCINTPGSFVCECPSGISGPLCEYDINECVEENPCENNSTCLNHHGYFECICPTEWTGIHCQHDLDECTTDIHTCYQGSTCINDIGSYNCACPAGMSGSHCGVDNDECLSRPCKWDARCVNTVGSFMCICQEGTTGQWNICLCRYKIQPSIQTYIEVSIIYTKGARGQVSVICLDCRSSGAIRNVLLVHKLLWYIYQQPCVIWLLERILKFLNIMKTIFAKIDKWLHLHNWSVKIHLCYTLDSPYYCNK